MNKTIWKQLFFILTCFGSVFFVQYSTLPRNTRPQLQQMKVTLIFVDEGRVCQGGYALDKSCPRLLDNQNIDIAQLRSTQPKHTAILQEGRVCDVNLSESFYNILTNYINSPRPHLDYSKRKSILVVLEWDGRRTFNSRITRGSENLYTYQVPGRTLLMFHRRAEEFHPSKGYSWGFSIEERSYNSNFSLLLRPHAEFSKDVVQCGNPN
ncbi:MAG: hypothetical protein IM504_04775 [Microcystis sp. M038S2]|jgi:hypothetical protein|uniref:hypothetical protein n=1 Tax=unclassified Microcystis TaxID=2643300 RepID=UPI00258C739A|nr:MULTISPECIES: hypothetical protein [unclassified Microcystis]MCA2684425.1 hypothetical protein [Microcystis sp. M046S2]MCA2704237.1 hypothetical protein [Microcystis sp. M038S2]MCA2947217.1 hypothetical protein [Microcystis sp. M109S1]MCA2953677.1 hypothetical protein [Microcystis sp. M112S1]